MQLDALGASPSPSPALSAYSYTSSSSTDDLSDLDQDIGSLSLECIEEPRYPVENPIWSTENPNWSAENPSWSASSQPARHHLRSLQIDPRVGNDASGTATPTNARSFTALNSLHHLASRSSDTAFSSIDQRLSPQTPDAKSPSYVDVDDNEPEADGDVAAFDLQDVDENDMHAEGVPAARGWRLDARQADTPAFRATVLKLFSEQLKLLGWSQDTVQSSLWPLNPDNLKFKRISGAFTNAVFFASYQLEEQAASDSVAPPTVLLRVYGASSEVLLSRRAELLILHTLSSLYEIGPHILGTFANGRVEEFYECDPIEKGGMRDFGNREAYLIPDGSLVVRGREGVAHWVARRMNELHSVPLEVMKTVLEQGNLNGPSQKGFGRGIENHIMASSHRPRRKIRPRPAPSMSDRESASPYIYGLDRSVRASPAPMGADDTMSPASPVAFNGHHPYAHRNSSAASLDSLATSYNSQSSFSPSMSGSFGSPDMSGSSGTDTPNSYFPSLNNGTMSPLALNPIGKTTLKHGSRGPYPGVWRRLKRWSREAAKVVELVEAFARSDSGAKAVAMCFSGHPSIRQEMQAGDGALSTASIGFTPGNLRNTLRAIRAIDLVSMYREVDEFKQFVRRWERREGPSRRVFSHNDAQYGNLLSIKHFPPGSVGEPPKHPSRGLTGDLPSFPTGMPRQSSMDSRRQSFASMTGNSPAPASTRSNSHSRTTAKKAPPPHHRIVVIDFEYASPNPRGYDIANHFQEWRADYDHPSLSWSLTHHGSYPDEHQRRKWLRAYVEQGRLMRMGGKISKPSTAIVPLETPTEMSLPPPIEPLQDPPAGSEIKGPITAEKSGAPVTPLTGATQVAALEKSLAGRPRPALSQNSSNGSMLRNSGDVNSARSLGRKNSNVSISSSSWQASSGTLRSSGSSVPGTPATPAMDASASPRIPALINLDGQIEKETDRLDREVQLWSPATHAVWGLWGIVFAKEDVETVLNRAKAEVEGHAVSESVLGEARDDVVSTCSQSFDNLRYALGRIELFRQEFRRLVEIGIENL